MKQARAVMANTTYPNTKESDLMDKVWHTVTDSEGKNFQVFAMDPIDAIDKYNKQFDKRGQL